MVSKCKKNGSHIRKQAGVTLLEMIIVLVIIGITMIALANYARKEAKQNHQQVVAEMIVRDISGVIKFTAQAKLNTLGSKGNPSTTNNPLYDSKYAEAPAYAKRVTNETLQDEPKSEKNDFYFGWSIPVSTSGQVSSGSGSRYLFLGTECQKNSRAVGALKFKLADVMLPCQLRAGAESLDLVLERVDFVNNDNSEKGRGIQRIDFYLVHQPEADHEGLHFTGFIKPLEKALRNAGLKYVQAAVVEVSRSGKFTLVKNNSEVVLVSDVASNMDLFDVDKQYGIRLSFDKSSEYIPADGSVPVAKMCWNDAKGEAGPCISAIDSDRLVIKTSDSNNNDEPAMCWDKEQKQSTLCLAAMNSTGVNPGNGNPDDRILHLRTTVLDKNGDKIEDDELEKNKPSSLKGTTGTLYANIVMENTSRRHPAKWHIAYNQNDANKLKDGKGSSESDTDGEDDSNLVFNDAFRGQYELVTPAVTFYQSFKNDYAQDKYPDGADAFYKDRNKAANYKSLLSEPGVIRLPLQTCPRVEGFKTTDVIRDPANLPLTTPRNLYPRLSVAISSVVADDALINNKSKAYTDYNQQGAVRANSKISENPLGAIAGVAVQANIVVNKNIADKFTTDVAKKDNAGIFSNGELDGEKDDWISDRWFKSDVDKEQPFWLISAASSMINIDDGNGINKINPQSLSVVITQWCSTIPQGGIISSETSASQYNWYDENNGAHKFLLHSVVAEDSDLNFYNDSGTEVYFPDHERMTY